MPASRPRSVLAPTSRQRTVPTPTRPRAVSTDSFRGAGGDALKPLSLLAGGSLGAALAALAIATGAWPPSSRATPLRLPPLALRDNKQHLSHAEVATLLIWARRYWACAVRHGLPLDPPAPGENEVLVTGVQRSKI